MKRLIIISVLFAVAIAACRTNEDNLATSEALNDRSATQWARVDAEETRMASLPTPAPVQPATATVLAAYAFLRVEQDKYAVSEANRTLDLTRTPIASPNPATVTAVLATVARIQSEQQFFADYEAGRVVVVTVTPTAVPVVTPTPGEVCRLVDLNAAPIGQIADLPADALGRRLGLERAGWIVAFRDNSGILNLDELLSIPGIGPRTVAAIRESECTVQR